MDEIESKIIRDFIDEAMDSGFECTPTFSMDEDLNHKYYLASLKNGEMYGWGNGKPADSPDCLLQQVILQLTPVCASVNVFGQRCVDLESQISCYDHEGLSVYMSALAVIDQFLADKEVK